MKRKPQIGDLAFHKHGHDPREVTRVVPYYVYLDLYGKEIGPCWKANYEFKENPVPKLKPEQVAALKPTPRGWVAPPLEEPQPGDVIVTHSEIEAYRQCPLKWKLAYGEKWTKQDRPDESPLSKGILYHEVMERHYRMLQHLQQGGSTEDREYEQWDLEIANLLWGVDGTQTPLQQLIYWMYQGYQEMYGDDPQWEILAVEQKFQARLTGPGGEPTKYLVKGKLDLVVRDRRTQKIWIVDHKSGSALPDEMELDLADQFGVYAWLLAQSGIEVIGVIHSANRTHQNLGDMAQNQDADGNPLKSSQKKQTLDQRMRRTLINRGRGELEAIARDFWAVTVNAYPGASSAPALPLYSSPDPRQCAWKCDFTDAHIAARKGRTIQSVLQEQGFVQHFEERY